MAINKKKTETTKGGEYQIDVKRVKQFESGDIAVDMDVNGVMIYGCVYKSGEKNGKEYAFLSFPSKKANDGKYYSHVYFKITDDMLKDIESQIESLL